MLNINNVSFYYRKGFMAVDDACADIGSGIYLLLGENGAGKTTLLHLISGLLFPKSGSCSLDEVDTSLRSPYTTERIFFVADDFDCPFATINELARRHGLFYPTFNYEMMRANLADYGMDGSEKLRAMSLGTRRKAFIAYSLALGVDYLLLDEPTNGMDISSKKIMLKQIGRCVSDDQCIIISTHNVHDLQTMFDHLMLMRRGRLRISMPVADILERAAFVSSPSPVPGAIFQEPEGGRFKAIIPNEQHIDTYIDYPLFYSAMMSEAGDSFIEFLTSKNIQL